jgi:hypothetical protein
MRHDDAIRPRMFGCHPGSARYDVLRNQAEARIAIVSRRQAELAAEARRLWRRRIMAGMVASRRWREDESALGGDSSPSSLRATRRAVRLCLRFHRTIEELVKAGGFDEAMRILRERKGDLAGRIADAEAERLSRVREWSAGRV